MFLMKICLKPVEMCLFLIDFHQFQAKTRVASSSRIIRKDNIPQHSGQNVLHFPSKKVQYRKRRLKTLNLCIKLHRKTIDVLQFLPFKHQNTDIEHVEYAASESNPLQRRPYYLQIKSRKLLIYKVFREILFADFLW